MGTPFFLKFGQFADRSIEALMFDPHGIEELERLARGTRTEKNSAFMQRLTRLLQLGDNPRITAKCVCGASATHVLMNRANDGASFGEFVCASCARNPHPWHEAMELKFASITRLKVIADRRGFIGQLKQAIGFGATERMTAEKAHAFFYPTPSVIYAPPRVVQREADKRGPRLPF